jgi:F-type H+-transporting ATPase subunit alpha
MHQKYADLMNKIETTRDLDKDAEGQLKAAVTEFKKSWA